MKNPMAVNAAHVYRGETISLMAAAIDERVSEIANTAPNRIAITMQERVISYSELDQLIDRLA